MDTETNRLKAKLSTLSESLDGIEAQLESLLSQTLPETIVGLETMQQAKLQVVLPYVVYDLVFIYLKAKGIDPKSHPVVAELDRVRQYFGKIKEAEETPKKRLGIDKDAAGRFIKHAIAQSKYDRPPGGKQVTDDVHVPVRITNKMLAREQYQKELDEMDSEEEEEDLKMFDEIPEDESDERAVEEIEPIKGKGKQKAADLVDDEIPNDSQTGVRRRRPGMDPFAGYGDDQDSSALRPTTIKNARPSTSTSVDVVMADVSQDNPGRSIPQFAATASAKDEAKTARQAKKEAKAAKKAKKAARSLAKTSS